MLALIAATLIYQMLGNPVIAVGVGVVSVGVLVLLYVTNGSMFEGVIQDIINVFNLSGHSEEFANGMLSLSDVVYYLSVTGVFLFLSVQSIQKRRWS